ncbi:MAG: hypothetical protein MJZ30_10085 [Paludibacteraceae bacterium]|nr:hypothetical protein [Paludibacteraceae bacterium]
MAKQVIKQYMSKHPIMTFFIGTGLVASLYGIVRAITISKEDYEKYKQDLEKIIGGQGEDDTKPKFSDIETESNDQPIYN